MIDTIIASLTALGTLTNAVCQFKNSFWPPQLKASQANGVHIFTTELDDLDQLKFDFENDGALRCSVEWTRKVQKIKNKVSKLLEQNGKGKGSSSSSSSSDSRKVWDKLHKELTSLIEEGNEIIEFISQPLHPDRARDIKKFATLQKPFEDILGWLESDNVQGNTPEGIKIHGAVGVGKTNIMLNLSKHQTVVKKFNPVIWLTVSREGNKKNLSRDYMLIALSQKLKFDVRDITNSVDIAERVWNALKEKKYLLLLDDVKEDIDLHSIGIRGGEPGSKVVITTRYRHVCDSLVSQNPVVKVNPLQQTEAWDMFREVIADKELIKKMNAEGLAEDICTDCCGVPLFIDKVASTFKFKNDAKLWTEGLNSWKSWPPEYSRLIQEVYTTLKFCYDDLDDDGKKMCFLYGVLYPSECDIESDHLLECWDAQHFLQTREDPPSHRNLVLGHLKDMSLLEEGKTGNHVKMHSFIRHMALHVVENENPLCRYLVKASTKQTTLPPDVKSWHEMNGVSFADNKLTKITASPKSSKLSTLFLNKNVNLEDITSPFFTKIEQLCVLDLSHTGIRMLPTSTAKLVNLKNLYLNDCRNLAKLPSKINKLHQLETLDIRRTGMTEIPPVVAKLTNLRRLRVSLPRPRNAGRQATFSYSLLLRLEELVIDVEPEPTIQWPIVPEEEILRQVSSLDNFKILKFCIGKKVVDVIKVASPLLLHISVSGATILQAFTEKKLWRNNGKSTTFRVLIGCGNTEETKLPGRSGIHRYIKYRNGNEGGTFPVAKILEVADAFELLDHNDIKQLSDFGTMEKLKYCLVENCCFLETIVGSATETMLSELESLYLKKLPKLTSIFTGQLQRGSLAKLQTLVFMECDDLKQIFPLTAAKQLGAIQHLEIESCSGVVEVIAEVEAVGNLQKLILRKLLNLTSIFTGVLSTPSFAKLQTLVLIDCDSLKEILPVGAISQLCGVQHLEIKNCSSIKKVIAESEALGNPKLLPKLNKLILCDMPALTTICKVNSLEWPSLEELEISECPHLHDFPFNNNNAKKLKVIKADQACREEINKLTNQQVKDRLQKVMVVTGPQVKPQDVRPGALDTSCYPQC